MADHPLRPAIHRSLGKPLPYQLANGTHAHLLAPELCYLNDAIQIKHGVLLAVSRGYLPLIGRLHTRYAPVRHFLISEEIVSFDLHVLGLPLAFVLSQDQTLHREFLRIRPRIIPRPLRTISLNLSHDKLSAQNYIFSMSNNVSTPHLPRFSEESPFNIFVAFTRSFLSKSAFFQTLRKTLTFFRRNQI